MFKQTDAFTGTQTDITALGDAASNTTAPDVAREENRKAIRNGRSWTANGANHPIVLEHPVLAAIALAALGVSEEISTASANIAAEEAAARSVLFEALPTVEPQVSFSDDGNSAYRLTGRQILYDAGRYKGRSLQADTRANIAYVEYWLERNDAVFAALEQYARILQFAALSKLSQKHITLHNTLERQIAVRSSGGVSDHSEHMLVRARVLELESRHAADESGLLEAVGLFNNLTSREAETFGIFSLENMSDHFSAIDFAVVPPSVLLTQHQITEAQGRHEEVRSSAFPHVMVEGFIENNNGKEDVGVFITLNSDTFAGLAYKSNIDHSSSRLLSAQLSEKRAREEFDREVRRLRLDYENLLKREKQLTQQVRQADKSVNFFFQQLNAGVKPIVEALRVYQTSSDVSRLLVSIRMKIFINRLQSARLVGALATLPG